MSRPLSTPSQSSTSKWLPADVDIETWQHTKVTGDGDWAEMQTDLDAVLVDTAGLNGDSSNDIADALLDRANGIETGMTLRQALRVIAAAAAGKLSGAATTTVTIRNAEVDDTDRIVATVDENGNRSAVTLDLT